MMTCARCGSDLPDMARYCPNCGEPVQASTHIEIHQDVGQSSGAVIGVKTGDVHGDIYVKYERSQVEELRDYLAQAVATYESRMYQLVARPPTARDQPYKFLYAFEIADADIFFGREAATEELYETVLKDRLTVLHAKSGAGKTSLLNAGLSPRLIREGRLPVYARAYDDPVRAIKRAIAPPSVGPQPELLDKLTLQEFLGQVRDHLSRETREQVIILDQFEEFFVFWPQPDHREPFINNLADCYADKALPLRIVLGIRGDYFTHLATFEHRMRHIFHNHFYLVGMSRGEALQAITGPVTKLGSPVTYQQDLLDALVQDLARGKVELPHLQIICTRLFETLAEGERTITLTAYEKLGGAEGLLGGYLNEALERLPGKGQDIAKEVLKELVSSETTKRVLGHGALAARIEAVIDDLDDVLGRLVDARLLRRDAVAGEATYEMAHEYLIGEIKGWIDQADLDFKQAQELLEREVANWRVHGILIPWHRLQLLYEHRERLTGLDREASDCLFRSALVADFAVEDWVEMFGVESAIAAMQDEAVGVRAAAGRAVAGLGDSRPGVGADLETGLPDIVWCLVPAGPFLVGSSDADETGQDAAKPQHEVTLPAFEISKYPITNAQFRAFLEAGGYNERRYWTDAGWECKERDAWTGPWAFDDSYRLPNEPTVGVSWYEAVAYCAWLTERLRSKGKIEKDELIRLPTEAEWEKASRGNDGRVYPWGNEFDADKCNVRETGINWTSAVGIFPAGSSPYGVMDLVGNVWEWCATRWQKQYPLPQVNEWDDAYLSGAHNRVVRGSSWRGDRRTASCTYRNWNDPVSRDDYNGFRVVIGSTSVHLSRRQRPEWGV